MPDTKGDAGRTGNKGAQGPKGEKGQTGAGASGVKYVRWGRTTCPNDTEVLYKGRNKQVIIIQKQELTEDCLIYFFTDMIRRHQQKHLDTAAAPAVRAGVKTVVSCQSPLKRAGSFFLLRFRMLLKQR